jgi:hypothetical protein
MSEQPESERISVSPQRANKVLALAGPRGGRRRGLGGRAGEAPQPRTSRRSLAAWHEPYRRWTRGCSWGRSMGAVSGPLAARVICGRRMYLRAICRDDPGAW